MFRSIAAAVCLVASNAAAQRPVSSVPLSGNGISVADSARQQTFFTRRDLAATGVALAATAAVSVFDVRIAHWWQQPGAQGGTSRSDLVHSLTTINESPLTIGSVAVYGIGRLTRSRTITDVGAHLTEAMVLTVAASEIIRAPVGRVRPRASPDDAFKFELGGGFTKFEDRSFPSLHSAVGFATAAVLSGEMRERHARIYPVASPLLYAAATIPGITRMYLNQHWASDVVAGAFLGTLLGSRVVSYGHSRRTKLDRILLGTAVLPDPNGGVRVSFSTLAGSDAGGAQRATSP
jgi:membrane-associated phospholipid phosphatase